MLLLTRLEKSKHQIEIQSFNLSELIQQILDQHASQIQAKTIQCLLDLEPNCMIHADRFWMQQTIANLLDNALDFSADTAKILIQLHRSHHLQNKPHIELNIFNEGEWIPDYALSQVFDTYFSLPRPVSLQRSSGIGLSIVKQVIEQHHGRIQIQNIHVNAISILQPHQQGVLVKIQLP